MRCADSFVRPHLPVPTPDHYLAQTISVDVGDDRRAGATRDGRLPFPMTATQTREKIIAAMGALNRTAGLNWFLTPPDRKRGASDHIMMLNPMI